MAFDSSGIFARVHNFEDDRDAAIKIRADRMDAEFANLKEAFDLCFVRDGRAVATGHWAMGGFRISGLAAASANGHAVRYEQLTALSGVYQPLDISLTGLGGLTWIADKIAYGTGPDTFALCDLTSFGRTLIATADAAAARTALGVVADSLVAHLAGTETFTGAKTFGARTNFRDSSFFIDYAGGDSNLPVQQFDANDYVTFNRSSNLWQWVIGGVEKMQLNGSTLTVGGSTVATESRNNNFSGANSFTGSARVKLSGTASEWRAIVGQTSGVDRWLMRLGNDTAESGSNAGSHFDLYRNNDAGSSWTRVLAVDRQTGVFTHDADTVFDASVAPTSVYSLGFRGVPLMGGAAVNAARTFSAVDMGKCAYHDEASARTYTIDSNANLPLPIGSSFVIDNTGNGGAAGAITLAITSDTLRRGDGTSGTGSRTIGANQVATVRKVKATEWVITGLYT